MVIDLKFFLKFKKGKTSLFFFLSSKSQQVSGWAPSWMPPPCPGWVTTAWTGVPAVGKAVWTVRGGLGCVPCGGVLHAHLWPSPPAGGLLVLCSQVFI